MLMIDLKKGDAKPGNAERGRDVLCIENVSAIFLLLMRNKSVNMGQEKEDTRETLIKDNNHQRTSCC